MSIFSLKKKDELVLVFDVGSSSVGGMLVRLKKDGVPKIISAFREPVILEKDFNIDLFLSSTTKSLEAVTNKIYMEHLGAPSRIFCVLSSPWYFSETRTIRFEKNTPFIFTSKLADSLIQKEISILEEEHVAKYKDASSLFRVIELKNIKTMLNGYEISSPLNKKAKEIEMAVFVSVSGEQVLKKIESSVRKFLHFKNIKFVSFALSSFTTLRDMYIDQNNFLLLDIGGEVTDISMIKKNILDRSVSFPLGSNFIIRSVASALGFSLDEAKSFLSLLKDGHASKPAMKKLEKVLNELKTDWLKQFEEALSHLSSNISVPSTIYVFVDKEVADLFYEMIRTEQFGQYTLTESKFKVVLLSAEVFHGMTDFRKDVLRDPSLIVDAIYINRLFS